MPNWCTNKLVVTATNEKDLNEFLEKVGGEDEDGSSTNFSFHSLVPRPEGVDWYDWNVQNWGTKWDVGDVSMEVHEEHNTTYFYFDSAWSPPIEWLEKVIPMFPQLDFTLSYFEGGMGFAGIMEGTEGDVCSHSQHNSSDEEYWIIATDGLSDEEIEDRARESIDNNALDYWDYNFERLVEIFGEDKRTELENLILIKKLAGEFTHSKNGEYNGGEIDDIVEKLMGRDKFCDYLFNEIKKKGELRRYAN
jgi:hypothetical protein